MDLFVRLDAWLSASLFASIMLVAWWAGTRARDAGARDLVPAGGSSPPASTRIEDASLALFGLLLAFCFAGAASRYDDRKHLLLDDALAIGGLSTVVAVLDDPERSELLREIRSYVEQRLVFGTMRLDDPRMPKLLSDTRAAHARITALVRRVIATGNTPTAHTALVNALNDMTGSHDKRLYGIRNQVPESIVLVLVVLGAFSTFTMGRLQDRARGRLSLLRIGAYVALVALVFAVTIDLQQPRRGLMRVSQAPMQDLLASLQPPAP